MEAAAVEIHTVRVTEEEEEETVIMTGVLKVGK